MTAAKSNPPVHRPADTPEAVDQFMSQLQHPFKAEIQALRRIIIAAEYFATVNLRAKSGVSLILHLGAKLRELPAGGVVISDPTKLLKWLGKDRAAINSS